MTRAVAIFFAVCLWAVAIPAAATASAAAAKARCMERAGVVVEDLGDVLAADAELVRRRVRRARAACESALKRMPRDPQVMQTTGALRLADGAPGGPALLRRAAETGSPAAMRAYADAILTDRVDGKTAGEAMELLERAARAGDRAAQVKLGMTLARGTHGVDRDTARALDLLRRYGDRGNAGAHLALGLIFLPAAGGEDADGLADSARARDYLQRAADAGLPDGKAFLGQLLVSNRGPEGEGEGERGRELIVASARAGSRWGAYFLGTLYELGHTGPRDPDKARRWYCRGGRQGIAMAIELFGEGACKDID